MYFTNFLVFIKSILILVFPFFLTFSLTFPVLAVEDASSSVSARIKPTPESAYNYPQSHYIYVDSTRPLFRQKELMTASPYALPRSHPIDTSEEVVKTARPLPEIRLQSQNAGTSIAYSEPVPRDLAIELRKFLRRSLKERLLIKVVHANENPLPSLELVLKAFFCYLFMAWWLCFNKHAPIISTLYVNQPKKGSSFHSISRVLNYPGPKQLYSPLAKWFSICGNRVGNLLGLNRSILIIPPPPRYIRDYNHGQLARQVTILKPHIFDQPGANLVAFIVTNLFLYQFFLVSPISSIISSDLGFIVSVFVTMSLHIHGCCFFPGSDHVILSCCGCLLVHLLFSIALVFENPLPFITWVSLYLFSNLLIQSCLKAMIDLSDNVFIPAFLELLGN